MKGRGAKHIALHRLNGKNYLLTERKVCTEKKSPEVLQYRPSSFGVACTVETEGDIF